jgi:hypothetical protein
MELRLMWRYAGTVPEPQHVPERDTAIGWEHMI